MTIRPAGRPDGHQRNSFIVDRSRLQMPVLLPNEVTQRHGERLAILQLHPLSILVSRGQTAFFLFSAVTKEKRKKAVWSRETISIRCCAWCSYSLSATKHKGKNTVTMYSMRKRMRFALKRLHLTFPIEGVRLRHT